MLSSAKQRDDNRLGILAVVQGQWGERIADYVYRSGPDSWVVDRWPAPRHLPPVVDDPLEFIPNNLPPVDLILALGETPGVVQLIPDIARLTGAKSVIAPIDRNESLPPGLLLQLRIWLTELGVDAVFPKPFCSLTETTYNYPPIVATYHNAIIQRFARRFGRPQFTLALDTNRYIQSVLVERDSACGCAGSVAQGLSGCPVDEAEYKVGMLHHHFPCLASMNQDADYKDTLMHVSGRILREAVVEQIRDHLEPTPYLRPAGRVEPDETPDSEDS
ncbi:MAG TPA: DUF166 family protein [Anaerolineae bacterium]|nr:DUF166 family protein [Anaerolineae bacterium]